MYRSMYNLGNEEITYSIIGESRHWNLMCKYFFTDPPEKCSLCVWSWSDLVGTWFCKLCLDLEVCGGPK